MTAITELLPPEGLIEPFPAATATESFPCLRIQSFSPQMISKYNCGGGLSMGFIRRLGSIPNGAIGTVSWRGISSCLIILRAAATHGLSSVLYHYYTSKNDAAGLIPTATSCVQHRHLVIDVKAGQNSRQAAPGGCKVNMESSYPRPLCLPLGKLVRWHYHLVIQGCKYLCYYGQGHPAAFPIGQY